MSAPNGLNIPAMTTDAERETYYRLTVENAHKGAVVELGAWMGASTAYIAAGMRDSTGGKVQVYDKFQSKAGHVAKVKAFYVKNGIDRIPTGPCLDALKQNLGPLMEFVDAHPGQIEDLKWGDEPIAVLITDAPKRIPQISSVMTKFRKALRPGSIMAWQDFCHFPSYEIPACLYRLRDHIEFVEAVVPGTTLVFRIKSQWTPEEVSLDALALNRWTSEEIMDAWEYWRDFVAEEKASLFGCGAALFICDIGLPDEAVAWLAGIHDEDSEGIGKKWIYLKAQRPDLVSRYRPLFNYLEKQNVFSEAA